MQLTSLRQLAARTYKCSPGTIRFSKPLTKEELTLKRAAVRQLVKKRHHNFPKNERYNQTRRTKGTTNESKNCMDPSYKNAAKRSENK